MQSKGIVRFFLWAAILVCLYQYAMVLPTNAVEADADAYAEDAKAEAAPEEDKNDVYKAAYSAYLDSMSNETVFQIPGTEGKTYQELKGEQLALGLDLKGGMSVVLQVDLREFIKALTENPEYEPLTKALDLASEQQKSAQSDYVSLFADAWASTTDKPMRDLFRRNEIFGDNINANTTNGEMEAMLREKATETVDLTFKLLKQRIDKLGVVQPNISLDAARDLIIVELPGIDNPERARTFLSAAAKLEFWDVYRFGEAGVTNALQAANDRLKKTALLENGGQEKVKEILSIDKKYVTTTDDLGNVTVPDSSNFTMDTTYVNDNTNGFASGPLFDIFTPQQGNFPAAVFGTVTRSKRDALLEMLSRDDVKNLFPRDLIWRIGQKPSQFVEGDNKDLYDVYAVKYPRGKQTAELSGDLVTSATANPSQTGEMEVSLSMDGEGSKIWSAMTTRAAQDGNRQIAILLDDEVVSAPRVNEAITGGRSSISGGFSIQEAKDLAQILEVGKLPARTEIIQESIVGPTLGAQNIKSSVSALVVGFLLVLAFMIFYYGGAGIVSIICLFLNLFFIFGTLASMHAVLTLPGLAGVVLTIGMAVDANVIIYERIREEMREGKGLKAAIADGFSNSYSAIIDANVTTILTAIVLAYFGLGPIKGFAVVLIIGVISSVFTAVLVGRLIIEWWVGKGNNLTFWTGASKNAFANMNIDFLGKRKVAYMISGAIIIGGIISMAVRGFDLGVDFTGGYSYNVEFSENVSRDQVSDALTKSFGTTPTVKAINLANTYSVVTKYNIDDTNDDAADKVMAKLHEGVSTLSGVSLEQFRKPDAVGVTHITSSSKVGPTIADDITKSAWYAAIFALLGIFLYILLRFNAWQYSAGAVAALFHDTFVVMGLFSIFWGILPFNMEIDQAFIGAILTVIGYSINDTVVVFDRIREYLNLYTGESKEKIINKAVNSTVSRTVITSLTTLFVVAILFVFGGGSIKGMAFALLIGIIVGTYSSIFVATPIMSDLTGEMKAKEVEKKKAGSFGGVSKFDRSI